MVNVVCVRVGDKYSEEYVTNLHKAVSRYLTIPHTFTCITDQPIEGIDCILPPDYLHGWWAKMYMFSRGNGLNGTIFYLDLDQIIIGDLNKFIKEGIPLVMIEDFTRLFGPTKMVNSSVMLFNKKECEHLWDEFTMAYISYFQGDQDYILAQAKVPIATWPREWVKSWKWEVMKDGSSNHSSDISSDLSLAETSILCFHGKPDPHEVLKDHWEGKR